MVAELNDGVFPPTLRADDIGSIASAEPKSLMEKHGNDLAALRKQTTDLSMHLGFMFGFLNRLSLAENDWHYAGKDVKLNTPDRPIFWYRTSKSSTTYQVLYADLSTKEVPADEVRKTFSSIDSSKP